jgi:predicted ATP-grasp superfamily ATP-dependent carboligase
MQSDTEFLTLGGIRFVVVRDLPLFDQCDACALLGPCDEMASELDREAERQGLPLGCSSGRYEVVTRG